MNTSIATNNTATETYTPANTTQQPITFLPAITEEQAINWSPDRYARHRRMVLTMLTRDHEQLLEAFGSDLELLEETLDIVLAALKRHSRDSPSSIRAPLHYKWAVVANPPSTPKISPVNSPPYKISRWTYTYYAYATPPAWPHATQSRLSRTNARP